MREKKEIECGMNTRLHGVSTILNAMHNNQCCNNHINTVGASLIPLQHIGYHALHQKHDAVAVKESTSFDKPKTDLPKRKAICGFPVTSANLAKRN